MTSRSDRQDKFEIYLLRIISITERGLISPEDARAHANELLARTMQVDFPINSTDNLQSQEAPNGENVTIYVNQGSGQKMIKSDQSVRVNGNITGASVVTGQGNTVTTTARVTLPPAHTVDPGSELAALRQLLAGLDVPERDRMNLAFQVAETEAARPSPDKDEVGGAVGRVLKAAKGANAFADQIEKLTPHVAALAAWVGPAGQSLLSHLGLSG